MNTPESELPPSVQRQFAKSAKVLEAIEKQWNQIESAQQLQKKAIRSIAGSASEIATMRNDLADAVQITKAVLKEAAEIVSASRAGAVSEIATMRNDLADAVRTAKTALREAAKIVAVSQQFYENADLSDLRTMVTQYQKEHTAQLSTVRKEHSTQLSTLRKELGVYLERFRKETNGKLDTIAQHFQQELADAHAELEEEKTQHAALKRKVSQLSDRKRKAIGVK